MALNVSFEIVTTFFYHQSTHFSAIQWRKWLRQCMGWSSETLAPGVKQMIIDWYFICIGSIVIQIWHVNGSA